MKKASAAAGHFRVLQTMQVPRCYLPVVPRSLPHSLFWGVDRATVKSAQCYHISVSRCTLGAAVQRTRGIVAGFAGFVLLGRLNCQLSTRVCRTLTPLVAQHGGLSHLRTPDGGFVRLSTCVLPPTHPFVRVSYVLSDCNPISAVILKSETCDTCNILTLERLPQIFRGDPATEPATDPGK
jgi:hypothetical protein